jgi:signal transduction histidine kinase
MLLGRLQALLNDQRQVMASVLGTDTDLNSLRIAHEQVLALRRRQQQVSEALLTAWRSESGLQPTPFDLAALTRGAWQDRQPEAAARSVRAAVNFRSAPATGDVQLTAGLAGQLLDNAVRHNVTGGWVHVTTGTRAGYAMLSVANSGPVIPPGDVGRLFEPFQQLTGAPAGHDGLGLGLALVRVIVSAHNAGIRARSLPGGGLQVQVRFRCLATGLVPDSDV